MAALINTLGGEYGFGENYLGRNDDESTWEGIDITSVFPEGMNFFGTSWNNIYVNNNGNITFSNGLYEYTPGAIGTGFTAPIIAPFWGDVDTRSGGFDFDFDYDSLDDIDFSDYLDDFGSASGIESGFVTPTPGGNSRGTNLTWYDLDPATGTITITWDDVGYFSTHTDKLNAFQLQLKSTGNGNFNITYIYEDINWVTGDASGGEGGLGGEVARAGFSAGDGSNYYEFYFSGNQNFMLNLEDTYLAGANEPGIWSFDVQSGAVLGVGQENSDDNLIGTDGNDIMDGRSGDDILNGGNGDDTVAGGEGNDQLFGGVGNDQLIGGNGQNYLDGGIGSDSALYAGIRNTLNVSENGDGTYQVLSDLFEDILANIEFIAFDDGRMSVPYAVEVRDNQEEFARFYNALFGRDPDTPGLTYWVNDLVNGNSIQNAAQAFTESPEFAELYGPDVENREFIDLLYQNILGRGADQAGYDYWLDEINLTGNRGGMIVSFANSEEYIELTSDAITQFLSDVPLDGYILI